jgi:hypothetical protein
VTRTAAFVVVVLALATVARSAAQTPGAAPPVSPKPCVPSGTNLDRVTPLVISETERAGLVKSYAAPEIVGLREALDRVSAGSSDAESMRAMQGVPPSLTANRFVVMSDERLFGGYWTVVQFQGHPEALYRFWTFDHGAESRDGRFVIRLVQRSECSLAEQHWLDVRYGALARQMPGA